jgi:hypothetical protein
LFLKTEEEEKARKEEAARLAFDIETCGRGGTIMVFKRWQFYMLLRVLKDLLE